MFNVLKRMSKEFARFPLAFVVVFIAIMYSACFSFAAKLSDSKKELAQVVQKHCANWESPDFYKTLNFPPGFVFGVAESDFQTSGPFYIDTEKADVENPLKASSNWWPLWIQKNKIDIKKVLRRWDPSVWKQDYDLIAQAGFNAMRIEAPWSKIELEQGAFNKNYVDNDLKERVRYLQSKGVQVWICLSHFVWPAWFEKLGAFEKKENIKYFVSFAEYIYKQLPDVKFWITFNEPLSLSLNAYWGQWGTQLAPGKKNYSTHSAAQVLLNILDAHVAAYHAMKKSDSSRKIGFIDNFAPSSKEKQNYFLYESMHLLGWDSMNDAELKFFTTGNFEWKTILGSVKGTNPNAAGALDFIGINYYGLEPVGLTTPEGDVRTEKGQLVYPFGLFEIIRKCSTLGKPIYITENGVSDERDLLKDRFIKQHLCAIHYAIKNHYPVRGYFYWTFMDTLSWKGYTRRYGLYSVNFDTQERLMRPGALQFIDYLKERKRKKSKFSTEGLKDLLDLMKK